MKKLTALVLALILVLSCVSALADYSTATVITMDEFKATRNIKIHPAGYNEVEDGISPITGLPLSDQLARAMKNLGGDFLGMAVTGEYCPVMVQHCGYAGAVGVAAPWYGSYADVIYELGKSGTGHTRMCFIFNDIHPHYAGASRSTRVGYIFIRQEWGCPYFYAGKQKMTWNRRYNTIVSEVAAELGVPSTYDSTTLPEQRMLFDGLDSVGGAKIWSSGRFRVQGKGMNNSCNLVWDLPFQDTNSLGGEGRVYKNHTWKFTDDLPETGDSAERVYVMFKNNQAVQENSGTPNYYYDALFEYEPDENVYYRYMITDLKNPTENAIPFVEQLAENVVIKGEQMNCDRVEGEPITFANVIIQFTDNKWSGGSECPYPIMLGTGNAEYFMGGKHMKGVWHRDTYEDRTVFYGEDGEEISLQRGRTYIVVMDYSDVKAYQLREIRYE